MSKSLILIASLGAAGATLAPSTANAYDIGDALIACASNDVGVLNRILDGFMQTCDLTKGRKSACAVVSGDPWVCNTKEGPNPLENLFCYGSEATVRVKIAATTSIPGWQVEGTAGAELTHYAIEKERKKCDSSPKDEPAKDGRAGAFVDYQAVLNYFVKFKVDGRITVTAGTGATFTIEASGSCAARRAAPVYTKQDTEACEGSGACDAPAPTTTLDADPTTLEPTAEQARTAICVVEDAPEPEPTWDYPDDYFDPGDGAPLGEPTPTAEQLP